MPILNKSKSTIFRTGVFFFIAMVLSVGTALVTCQSIRSGDARTADIEDTHKVLLQLAQVQSTLQELIANARGYALSGQHADLLGFETARSTLFQLLDVLRTSRLETAEQIEALTRLGDTIGKYVELEHTRIDAEHGVHTDRLDDQARAFDDHIRRQLAGLIQVINRQHDARLSEHQRGVQWSALALVFNSIVSGVILVAAYLSLKREILANAEAQSEARLTRLDSEALYNQAPCGYHSVREDSQLITRINDTELAWLGYTREQVVGKMTQVELLTPESAVQYQDEVLPKVSRGTAIPTLTLDYRRADGSRFPVLFSTHVDLFPDGQVLVSHHVVSDITQQQKALDQLDQLRQVLTRQEQQLGIVSKELESFSYSISHDLRAPLRAISGYALMIEEDFSAALGDKGTELLQVIGRNVKKMDTLINDLLTLSKCTTVALSSQHFSMQALVQERVRALEQLHQHVEFIVTPLDDITADAALIGQVWQQLLDNAVKFSSKTASPQVRISSRIGEHEVIYEVSDNGVGFDMRYVHKLFGTFQRLHRQEEFAGSGVGLALAQRIVMRHGGRVWAHSAAGEGTHFYFALPRTTL